MVIINYQTMITGGVHDAIRILHGTKVAIVIVVNAKLCTFGRPPFAHPLLTCTRIYRTPFKMP